MLWDPHSPQSSPLRCHCKMIVAKRILDGAKVLASEEQRGSGPWCCPECSAQVSLKKGDIKIHHFAHHPPFSCEYGSGESEEHSWCKTSIYETMRRMPNASKWELERSLGSVRPDVSGYIGNTPVAIEVQASSLGLERIAHRTREYATKGVFVLWLAMYREGMLEERFSPSVWEKWLHALYFGRVYYWLEKDFVGPVHFDDHLLYVEEKTWMESGVTNYGGGYHRRSKRFRKANPGKTISITEMNGVSRTEWSGGGYNIPTSKLWMDQLTKWW